MSLYYVITLGMLLTLFFTHLRAKQGFGSGEQDWGFVEVRQGAHMFYWLYYTTANVANYTERPLVIWLPNGFDDSASGGGNFGTLGPQQISGEPREHSWVQHVNVLFIDSPVGSGFSYVNHPHLLTTTNKESSLDLVALMKGFYQSNPAFEAVPLHIFSEGNGAKVAAEFALELHRAVRRAELRSHLKSVVLSAPWVSPIDSIMAWAPTLWHMGVVDSTGYWSIMCSVYKLQELVNCAQWKRSAWQWWETVETVSRESKGVDFSNILLPTSGNYTGGSHTHNAVNPDKTPIVQLMRENVSVALNISKEVLWGSQSNQIFQYQEADFMKSVSHIVKYLLDYTEVKVGVVTGQMDLISGPVGIENWLKTIHWRNRYWYDTAPRVAITVNGVLEGYEKSSGDLSMFWINRAGHTVPAHNPAAMSSVLKKFTNYG